MKTKKFVTDKNIEAYKIKQTIAEDNGVLNRVCDLSNQYDNCVLVFIGDWHIGTVDFDIEEATKVINYVLQTPNARMFCLGDMMNTAILNSVSNMYEDIAYPQEQWKVFVSLLKQVAEGGKLVVTHTGNHERRIGRNTGIDPVEQAAGAMGAPETYAPYYADTYMILKCPFEKSKKYVFPLVTHHGDSGNPENNASVNQESIVNAIGHTHQFKHYTKTKIITKNGKKVKKDELNIVIPASGGGCYGYEKGYRPISKCPYYALEVTPVQNPLYDKDDENNMEPPIVLATKSIAILQKSPTTTKEKCIKEGKKIINEMSKKINDKMQKIYKDLEKVIDKYSEMTIKEIDKTLPEIVENSKAETVKQTQPKKVEQEKE